MSKFTKSTKSTKSTSSKAQPVIVPEAVIVPEDDGSSSAPNVTFALDQPYDSVRDNPAANVIVPEETITPAIVETPADTVAATVVTPAPKVRKLERFGALIVLAANGKATPEQLQQLAMSPNIASRVLPGHGLYTFTGRALTDDATTKVARAHLVIETLKGASGDGDKIRKAAKMLLPTIAFGAGGFVHEDTVETILASLADV